MVKISRKVGIAIALSGLLFFGGCAYGISKIKFKSLKSEIKNHVAPFQEVGGVLFNENLADEFLNFEYQFLLGEYHSRNNEYEKAMSCYEEAIKSAKTCLGVQSFFTSLAYEAKAYAEQKHKHFKEAHEDFKAALRTLPEQEEYDTTRLIIENWIISTGGYQIRNNDIHFYRKHLALTEKLFSDSSDYDQIVLALWYLGEALDRDKQFAESQPIWTKFIREARAAKYSERKFETYLLDFAYHEMYAAHYPQSAKAITEALKIASDTGNDKMAAGALEAKGELHLRQDDLVKAENAFQACLDLRKKLKDNFDLSWAYDCLGDVARRNGNQKKREEYLKLAMQTMDDPIGKADYLATLVFIAAPNNRTSQAGFYFDQWKKLKTESTRKTFILEEDLKNLLALYPQLRAQFDSKKLEPSLNDYDRQGYLLSTKQTTALINCVSSKNRFPSVKNLDHALQLSKEARHPR